MYWACLNKIIYKSGNSPMDMKTHFQKKRIVSKVKVPQFYPGKYDGENFHLLNAQCLQLLLIQPIFLNLQEQLIPVQNI